MNIDRLQALEDLERGLRVEMGRFFTDTPMEAVQHPCGTACCHGGWTCVLAHSLGQVPASLMARKYDNFTVIEVTAREFLGLSRPVACWLFDPVTRVNWFSISELNCSEREGRLRLRILIELQTEDVALLTAELRRRMAEPEAAAVASEICEAVPV